LVDLNASKAADKTTKDVSRQPGPGTELQDVVAEVDAAHHARNDPTLDSLGPLGARAEGQVLLVHRSPSINLLLLSPWTVRQWLPAGAEVRQNGECSPSHQTGRTHAPRVLGPYKGFRGASWPQFDTERLISRAEYHQWSVRHIPSHGLLIHPAAAFCVGRAAEAAPKALPVARQLLWAVWSISSLS
jgi:hypothetical protein